MVRCAMCSKKIQLAMLIAMQCSACEEKCCTSLCHREHAEKCSKAIKALDAAKALAHEKLLQQATTDMKLEKL